MKIAIFGDSYADPYNNSIEAVSWTKLLKEKSNDYKITNFAYGGTSLWWSYELFLKNYEKFDTIIFVITTAGRLSNLIYNKGVNSYDYAVELEETIKNGHPNNLTDPQVQHNLKLLESAKDYYLYFQNNNQEKFLHEKIIEELYSIQTKLSDKKFIIIPTVPLNFDCKSFFKMPLLEITKKELEANFGNNLYKFETGYRANHMSKKNNEILAEKIHQIIQGTCTEVTIDDFVFQKYPNPEKYWEI